MNTFRKLVTGVSSGTTPVSRLKFYGSRLAQEAATRKIATVLMIGLLIFQVAVFLFPPTSARANQCSENNIIRPCGITDTSNQGVLNALKGPDNAIQLMNQLGVTDSDVLNGTPNQTVCKGQNPLSMGREAGSGGSWLFPGHTDIYVGPASSRWQQECFSAELLGNKVRGSDIGTGDPNQWYQVGILYACGNLVFIPTSPPSKSIACTSLEAAPLAVDVNQPIKLTGRASGQNIPNGELVDMSYLVYRGTNPSVNTTPLVTKLESKGIPWNGTEFIDDNPPKQFQTDQPDTYTILLAVGYNNNGAPALAPGSGVNECQKVVTVKQPAQPTIVCQNLSIAPTTLAGGQPLSNLTGTAQLKNSNDPNELADMSFIFREKQADGSFTEVPDAKGKSRLEAAGLQPSGTGIYTAVKPSSGDSNDTFFMPTSTQQKTYQVFLRIYWRGHQTVSDAFSVPACQKEITVPPVQNFACSSLKANPTSGSAPLDVNFDAAGIATNTTVSAFKFDYGDGQNQTVNTNQPTARAVHKYTKGGRYTASVIMQTAAGTTSVVPVCQAVVTVNESDFAKIAANITLLTSDRQPTDANGAVARAGDQLRYTIGVQNKGGDVIRGFVFDDDITDILVYADVVDPGGAQAVKQGATTKLVWAPIDIPVGTSSSPGTVTKQFTVKLKDPIPFVAQKTTDLPGTNDCQLTNTFRSKVVVTPLGVDINKQIECVTKQLPQTGAGWSIVIMAMLAAASFFLLLRNRLLKRELQLVETLTEGA
ncbi:PKD domain-containing protein [Candidatus Saccharibacteria bacterium]|nr:PKD domain-containing protein [Candidatus Saccharibacteria bacterium]